MTKHRPPLTFAAALARIVGQLPGNWEDAALVSGRAISTVRNWSNPDRTEDCVPIDCAIALDLAYRRAGGIGAPFYEAFTVQLEMAAVERFAAPAALMQLLPEVMKENSDAELSLVAAARPDADRRDYHFSLREIDEAIARFQQARTYVSSLVNEGSPQATGPP